VLALAPASAQALSNTVDPTITPAAEPKREAQQLTGNDGTWVTDGGEVGPPSTTHEWRRCDAAGQNCNTVLGTAPTYNLVAADVGSTIVLRVTANCFAGCTDVIEDSAPTGVIRTDPSNDVPPTISGTAQDGQTLSIQGNAWSGAGPFTLAYQWFRCNEAGGGCILIAGATLVTYTLTSADVGATIRVQVTGSGGTSGPVGVASAPSGVVAAVAPQNSTPPTVGGTFREGETVGAFAGSWTGTQPILFALQWQRCSTPDPLTCQDIAGATGVGYRLVTADVNQHIRVRVVADNPAPGTSGPVGSAVSDAVAAAPGRARPRLMSPFPRVAIGGVLRAGVRPQVTLLRVRGPRGSTVTVRCRGRGCPVRRVRRRIPSKGEVRIKGLERKLPAGTVIEVRVTQPGTIGKFTRFRIRSLKRPARTDACLRPGSARPSKCP
jgi:hypothetical protein